jgi:hypothetical protein
MDDAEARRRRRLESLSIKRFDLGDEPDDDISATTTAEERLAMMWPLARRAWSISGRAFPEYSRAEMPGCVIRGTR